MSFISWDGTNTPVCGFLTEDELLLISGQFTSIIKDSEDVTGVDSTPQGISWNGTDTPWVGSQADKLYLQSGQFTSTLKTSEDISGVDATVTGIETDDDVSRYGGGGPPATANTPWAGSTDNKLYLQSGQFTSTLKDSIDVTSVESNPDGNSWDLTNTSWSGYNGDKVYISPGSIGGIPGNTTWGYFYPPNSLTCFNRGRKHPTL